LEPGVSGGVVGGELGAKKRLCEEPGRSKQEPGVVVI